MRIVLVYLKWSYGIEVLANQLASQFSEQSEVTLISGKRPYSKEGTSVAWEGKYIGSVLAFANPLVSARLFRKIRSLDPQVVYFISPHVINVPLLLLSKWFTDAVVISHIHDPEYSGHPLVAMAANFVARIQSRWSHRVYCWGNAIKKAISLKFQVHPDRIAVYRHGPGHRTPADDITGVVCVRPPRYFSMIGTIIPRKGLEYYLEAARLFNERHGTDAAQFLVAGSGDLTRYKAAIGRLPNLTVMNRFLEDAEVNELLASSYASVLPYTAGVMQSSFIAIAYGNACPVIVSDIGSLPEEVENGVTGYVVERANADDLAAAMSRIYSDPVRVRMEEKCVATYRERFNWDAIAGQMYRDMENSLSERKKHIYLGHEIHENQR